MIQEHTMRHWSLWIAIGLFGVLSIFLQHNSAVAQAPKELTIQEAITLALEHNPQIRQGRQALAAAEGQALQDRSVPRPELSATWTGIPRFSFGQAEEREIGLSQPFEFPGKRHLRGQIGDLRVAVVRLELERLQSLVKGDVKRTYYTALAPRTEIDNLESVRSLLSGFLESTLSRYQGGNISFVEVLRFKVELARVDNDLIEARHKVAVQQRELNLMLGPPAETPHILTDRLEFTPFTKTLEAVQAESLKDSQSLRIAGMVVQQFNQGMKLARMGYYPDFRVGAFQFNSPSSNSNDWTAEVALEIPLWGWWEQKGKLREAGALREGQVIRQEALERAIQGSLASAFERVKAAETQIKMFQTSLLIDTDDALQSAITEYQFNRIDALNLLDIYRTYKATQVEYTRALLNYQMALVGLEVAAEPPNFSLQKTDAEESQSALAMER